MKFNRLRIIRTVRLALAMIVCFIVARIFNVTHPMWIFITLIVVLFDQATVGGAVFRGSLRVGATVLGAIIGMAILLIFKNNQLANEATIVIGVMVYAYLFMDSKYSYIGVLGSITLIIVLGNDNGITRSLNGIIGIDIPIMRVFAIILGTAVAVISMIIFFPQYAKIKIKEHIAKSLSDIEFTIQSFLNHNLSLEDLQKQILDLEGGLTSGIAKFVRLSDEMRFETKIKSDYTPILLHLRRINRLLNVVFYNLPNAEIREIEALQTELTILANVFHDLKDQVQHEKINSHIFELKQIQYREYEVKSFVDYDLIFIYSILNRIINETKLLITELEKNVF